MTEPVKDKQAPASATPPTATPEPASSGAQQKDTKALEEQMQNLMALVEKQNQQLEAQQAQLQAAENDAKRAEVRQLAEAAVNRGVDAFTVNAMRSILLALPRKTPDVAITLEEGGQKQEFPNLYAALTHFLAKAPANVPVGQETTRSEHDDPSLEQGKVDTDYARRLAEAAGAMVKEA